MRDMTTVAYRCPSCGAILTFDVTQQRLSKGKLTMHCIQCDKSKIEIELLPTGTVSLVVPCLVCPHSHPYKISKEMFFSRDVYCFPCSFSGLDICIIGEMDNVEYEIIRTGREISDMIDQTKEADENAKGADMLAYDTSVMREVLFALGRLSEEKKISCSCGSKSVKVVIDYDKASVICKVCSKKKDIPARTRFDANAAIDLDNITIE